MASRVQTAVTMRQVTGSMMNVVKGMDQAMKAMDLEKVCLPDLPTPPPHFPNLFIHKAHSNNEYGRADFSSNG